VKARNVTAERAFAKIQSVLGEKRGSALIAKALSALKLNSLETVDDCYRFGDVLTRDGGVSEAIGRAIMVQAILAGAQGKPS
jgi:hypothetical protein